VRTILEKAFLWEFVNHYTLGEPLSEIYFFCVLVKETTPVAARSWAWVCGRSLAGIPGFESRRGHGSMSCACRVLSGRGLCAGLITRAEECCRVWYIWVWSWRVSMRRSWPTRTVAAGGIKMVKYRHCLTWLVEHISPPYNRTLMFHVSILWESLLDPAIVGIISKVHKLTMAAYECFVVKRARAKLHCTLYKLTNHYNTIN
jgi:hypothetical protein